MLDTPIEIPYWFELAAILTGGLSGAMSAVRSRFDIFGCVFIACVTGLGGGMIRDLFLQHYGIYAFQNPSLLLSCIIAGIVVFYFGKLATYLDPIVDLLDNLSVAFWAIIGVGKSLSAGLDIIPAILLGTITAVGGGIMRDTLMNKPPEAFQSGPLYGSAALIGCTLYSVMKVYNFFPDLASGVCIGLILIIRYGSLTFGWRTHPPRDYSETLSDAVVKPVKFIAKKAHVPIGKTARERDKRTSTKTMRLLRRFYRRISGQWMNSLDDANSSPSGRQEGNPTVSSSQSTVSSLWSSSVASRASSSAPPEQPRQQRLVVNVPKAMVIPLEDESAADRSDRIFVNREELFRILGKSADKPLSDETSEKNRQGSATPKERQNERSAASKDARK